MSGVLERRNTMSQTGGQEGEKVLQKRKKVCRRNDVEQVRERELLRHHPPLAIQRFEHQPQLSPLSLAPHTRATYFLRLQSHHESLKYYLQALGMDAKSADKVAAVVAGNVGEKIRILERSGTPTDGAGAGVSNPASTTPGVAAPPSSADHSTTISSAINAVLASAAATGEAPRVVATRPGDTISYGVGTSLGEWERALRGYFNISANYGSAGFTSTSSSASASTSGSSALPSPPIHIVVNEAWSWSSFSRKVIWVGVLFVLTMTGLSVVMDQQGMKSGEKIGISPTEMEPNALAPPIKFSDVQGVDEAKGELEEIVAFLREPRRFMEIGGKLPKGILLYGPPGTGKTHLARAVAGEAGVPFFHMSGSEFDELYVGVGARRVRELFAAAKRRAPCIVFIDELDAVGSKRSARDSSYMRQTLNQLLVELDGFSSSEGVILIGATNTPEALDKALTRPGRFDRHVAVPLPDVRGRLRILEVHSKSVTISREVDMHVIARGTPGFSGADLANLVNQAAIKASKEGAKAIRMQDMEWAKDRIVMGAERKSAVVTEHNKRLTAYHEGGHALVAMYTAGAMPLHKVTVIPRGQALGLTVQLPEGDVNSHTKRELIAMIDVSMGGRAAEELVFGPDEITTGASNDLEKATEVAREMIMSYGMSDKIGPVSLVTEATMERGGGAMSGLSPDGRKLVEGEIKQMLEASHQRATNLLKSRTNELHRLVAALMEHETLALDEIKIVVSGGKIKRWDEDLTGPAGGGEKVEKPESEREPRIPDIVPGVGPARM
ncbi:hypothetical protein HDU93_000218 [Gonapodya sp. JEL0774]|nr:hypothetical protein HDU93_000218 [Gonapodya sp. JEL0774]